MIDTLFPDYAALEYGRNEAQAMRLAERLREVDLQTLVTDADRRMVVARLRREGIDNAMQLVNLTEEVVLGWYNVGHVFLTILKEMRDEVLTHPERVIAHWRDHLRLLVLPDDLEEEEEPMDFFGTLMTAETEFSLAEETEVVTEERVFEDDILELERCLVAAIRTMEYRWEGGEVLRKFFLEGLPVETIVKTAKLASNASLFRIVSKLFAEPLLTGYPVKGIQFSHKLLSTVKKLKKELLYSPAYVLECLEKISPMRFLFFLDLTLLQRTTAESAWGGDYIVKIGEVQRCRKTLHDLFAALQWRVVPTKENAIRNALKPYEDSLLKTNVRFLRALLHQHPWIERSKVGYRLVAERLCYDLVRIARIVYDLPEPTKLSEIYAIYERCYFERPLGVSITSVREHFPHIRNIRRGVWFWKKGKRK